MIPKNRQPNHPGEILDEEFLKPLAMTQGKLAEKMGVTVLRGNVRVSSAIETMLGATKVFAGKAGTSAPIEASVSGSPPPKSCSS
jgi:hypothetical protein